MSLGSLNMGVRTELGWGCKQAARLCVVAQDDRPHSSVRHAGPRVRRNAWAPAQSTPGVPTQIKNVTCVPWGPYNQARRKGTLDLKREGELQPDTGKEKHSTREGTDTGDWENGERHKRSHSAHGGPGSEDGPCNAQVGAWEAHVGNLERALLDFHSTVRVTLGDSAGELKYSSSSPTANILQCI